MNATFSMSSEGLCTWPRVKNVTKKRKRNRKRPRLSHCINYQVSFETLRIWNPESIQRALHVPNRKNFPPHSIPRTVVGFPIQCRRVIRADGTLKPAIVIDAQHLSEIRGPAIVEGFLEVLFGPRHITEMDEEKFLLCGPLAGKCSDIFPH